MMDVSPVLELLRKKIGLNPKSIGFAAVEGAVLDCLKKSGMCSVEDYVEKVQNSAEEMGQLIESVLVQETSFFRNRTPFVTLKSYLKQFVFSKKRVTPLRILCLPCSTGEEAYSIAMVLLDMNLPANNFHIDAGDISEHVLQIAMAGRYKSYAFRGKDVAAREKYFSREEDDTYVLRNIVRDAVHFERINLVADHFLPGHKPYDVIFCRNLLIYFDDVAKAKAIRSLSRNLSEEGILFVGHAEGASVSKFGLSGLDYPMSFVYAKRRYAKLINNVLNQDKPDKKEYKRHIAVNVEAGKVEPLGNRVDVLPVTAVKGENDHKKINTEAVVADQNIEMASKLADSGLYDEVVVICQRLLAEGVESAEVYYLLGQVAGAAGDSLLAEEYLKKTIYINADHHDALVYLSLLYGQMGNLAEADSFRKRAQRVKLRQHKKQKNGDQNLVP